MNFRKDYSSVIALYVLVLIYVILVNDKIVTSILIIGLFAATIVVYNNVRKVISDEKDASVNTLLTRLDKSKKESEETYKRFLSLSKTLGSGVFMVDDNGWITFSNKDVENFFDKDINNMDYGDLLDIPPLHKFVNEAYLLEDHMRRQISVDDKSYDLISTPLYEGDMFAGSLFLVHDITQLKNAEKFQKRFTADVSHELRTPLSAIKGFSEILLRDEEIPKENFDEFLGLINKESERMEVILNDLIVISKMDRLDYELELEKLDIKPVIEEAVGMLTKKFEEKKLIMNSDIESCILRFSKVKMSQVIINIVKNAINYTDSGFVNIQGVKENGNYVIRIQDSGIGIKKDKQELIFKRFYRVDKARSRDSGGSGLGLSISKNVILKHKGTISVESKEDNGSTFTIALPIKE